MEDPEFGHVWKENGKYWEMRKEREEQAKTSEKDLPNVDTLKI